MRPSAWAETVRWESQGRGVLVTLSALTPAWGGLSSLLGTKPGSARSAPATLRARPRGRESPSTEAVKPGCRLLSCGWMGAPSFLAPPSLLPLAQGREWEVGSWRLTLGGTRALTLLLFLLEKEGSARSPPWPQHSSALGPSPALRFPVPGAPGGGSASCSRPRPGHTGPPRSHCPQLSPGVSAQLTRGPITVAQQVQGTRCQAGLSSRVRSTGPRLMPLLWAGSQTCSCTCPLQARGG